MQGLISSLTELTGTVKGHVWGVPTIVLLVGTGVYLTWRMGFLQFRGFRHALQLVRGKYDKPDEPGEVTHFQALATALSATVGTGNIAGVATAITLGGPGAVFWMWVTAFFGMATKYTSCTLALKFRYLHPNGEVSGGPMYTLKHGLNMPRLAAAFAFFALIASFGIGNMVQANSVVDGLTFIFPEAKDHKAILGFAMAVAVGLVIIGGIRRIARVASRIVPFMAVVYCGAALLILVIHLDQVPAAFATIFQHALNPWAVGGGAIGSAIQYGVARGVFSNEAGLGSAPMAHAAARTKEPVREGLVAMLEPFIDTIVICTMTALVIVIMGAWGDARPAELKGAALSAFAFQQALGQAGAWVVGFGLMFFAYSTIIAWSYYGDRSAEFLFGERAILPYRIVYTVLVAVGAAVPLQLVWNFADIANIFMAVPNLISLLLLAGLVKRLGDEYLGAGWATQPRRPDRGMHGKMDYAMAEKSTESGLKYEDLVEGNGATAEVGKLVTVHYTGWLTDGTKFDSSKDRNDPFKFPLGGGRVIPGWDEGVQGMQIGGTRKLTIPPHLGYGSRGAGGVIPPNATLVFEVELLEVA